MVKGPPFYDENEWEPDDVEVEKRFTEWLGEWTGPLYSVSSSADWHPESPTGNMHGHRMIDKDGKMYTNFRGEWVLDGS